MASASSRLKQLWQQWEKGDRRALAKLLTAVENGDEAVLAELEQRFQSQQRDSHVVGITGPPGVGKSSLLDELLVEFCQWGAVALVAIDPSSQFSGGAFLGDRLRMGRAGKHPRIFIRSMANRGHLGGLSAMTEDVIRLLALSGFETIFVETVGVGQGEQEILYLADTVVLVLAPGGGDHIQMSKAGVMEIGHIYVVQKADLPEAEQLVEELQFVLRLRPSEGWTPIVLPVSAKERRGIEELALAIRRHWEHCKGSPHEEVRRHERYRHQLEEKFIAHLLRPLEDEVLQRALGELATEWQKGRLSLSEALSQLERTWQQVRTKAYGTESTTLS